MIQKYILSDKKKRIQLLTHYKSLMLCQIADRKKKIIILPNENLNEYENNKKL